MLGGDEKNVDPDDPANKGKITEWEAGWNVTNAIQVSFYIPTYVQRDRTWRALLEYQNFNFLFYLGCIGSFTQSKHNIMKVVQS